MTERREKRRVQQSFDATLTGLMEDPWLAQRVMVQVRAQSQQDEPVKGRKKLSVGLVLVLAIMLVAVVAVALTLSWQQYAADIKTMEHEQGAYADWPVEDRVNLVRALVEMGYLPSNDRTEQLFSEDTPDAQRQAIADRLLMNLTGAYVVEAINLEEITYAIMGYSDFWTPEQRVWWEKITYMFTPEDERKNPERLVVPDEKTITEQEAIDIARREIIKAYALPEDALDQAQPVANLYVTTQHPDVRRWHVVFNFYMEGTDHYAEREYSAVLDSQGNVIADPDIGKRHLSEEGEDGQEAASRGMKIEAWIYRKYEEQAGFAPFWEWPYEMKAAYSTEVLPLVARKEAMMAEVGYSTTFAYGFPTEDELQYASALQIAQQTLMSQFGMSAAEAASFGLRYESYDVTEKNNRRWKFTLINPDDYYGTWYQVEILGATGEVVRAEKGHWQERDYMVHDNQWLF